jgi:Fe-S-cluster containining protein
VIVLLDIDDADRTLLRVLDTALTEGAAKSGRRLACTVGCTECCIGPFAITQLDARRLRRGLSELSRKDPARAARVRLRARQAVQRMAPGFPGAIDRGLLNNDVSREEEFFTWHAALPCPVLDPVSGTCDLYAWRPISCRTYGPPIRFGSSAEPPCHLCFKGATKSEVESCRVEIDPDGMEDTILSVMESEGAPEAQTVIAWAVLDRGRS